MNKFKGTQSDWKEAGHNDNGIFISGGDSQSAIAHVYYNNNTVKIGEGKANARLIVNAPAMYKALLAVWNDFNDSNSSSYLHPDEGNMVREVLNNIHKEI